MSSSCWPWRRSVAAVAGALLAATLTQGAARGEAPLTVFVHARDVAAAKKAATRGGLHLMGTWDRIGVAVARGALSQVRRVSELPGVTGVELDQPLRFDLNTSHNATRGNLARTLTDATGRPVDGRGVSIAIIDSGIDGTHPFFQQVGQSKVVRNLELVCPEVCVPPALRGLEFADVTSVHNDTDTISAGGHGTHVAGIAAGVDVVDGRNRALHGAAPGAKLVGLSAGLGVSLYGMNTSMHWVLENHAAPCGPGADASACPPIKVVNLSISASEGDYNPGSATAMLQDALVAEGVVVVWSAGNFGGDGSSTTVYSHKQSPTPGVITAANYDDRNTGTRNGRLDASSSRGERGRVETYPDLSAPGSTITSSCRVYLPVCHANFGTDRGELDYNTLGGTSMAAPHVTGVVAQLFQANPSLAPAQVEDILEDTAYQFQFPGGGAYEPDLPQRNADHTTSFDKGHGLVDAHAAVSRALAT